MRKFKRFIATGLVLVLTLTVMACGEKQVAMIDQAAAQRGIDEDVDNIYIDDEAIALADSAPTVETAVAAATSALALVNQRRVSAGLAELAWSDDLASAARVRAEELKDLFSHDRPNGSAWYTVNSSIQYGENLAKLYYTADSVVTAWMNSPTHAANIMDGGFKTCGIAVYQAPNGNWYWAQEFGY
ncbi:MAG: CAP domain-containing protein [Butyrivibrio sp.]|nr:CAP domain-containing protein [Butyrivibrio sp.]